MNFTHILLLAYISLVSCSQSDFSTLYNTLSTTGAFPANVFDLAREASKEDVEAINSESGLSLLHAVTDPTIYKILLEKNPSLSLKNKDKTPLQHMKLKPKSKNVDEIIQMLQEKQSEYDCANVLRSISSSKKRKSNVSLDEEDESVDSDKKDKKENNEVSYKIPAIILILIIIIVIFKFLLKKRDGNDDAFGVKEEKDLI